MDKRSYTSTKNSNGQHEKPKHMEKTRAQVIEILKDHELIKVSIKGIFPEVYGKIADALTSGNTKDTEGSMDIHSKPGTKVIFTGLHGTDSDREYALSFLKPRHEYIVHHTAVHNWHTDVYIEGIDGHPFNSVHFTHPPSGEKLPGYIDANTLKHAGHRDPVFGPSEHNPPIKKWLLDNPQPPKEVGNKDYDELATLVADLREVFVFPPEKDYDNGYSWDKKDGWCISSIVADPKLCLEMMINNCSPPEGWVSIKDRLPEEPGAGKPIVLITEGIGCVVYEALYEGDGVFCTSIDSTYLDVTHWMPLPSPPEEVK